MMSALDEIPGPVTAQFPSCASLTRRENEVLMLLAAGLSDRSIAAKLYVSPRTVEKHVAHLREKLGAGSRSAAVANAARIGLL